MEKSIRHQSDPNGNLINLTKHSFIKTEFKLLNKNLNFVPAPKVYDKNELDADLNDFFKRISKTRQIIKLMTRAGCSDKTKTKNGLLLITTIQ